jgi:hypothetical protein
LVLHGGLILDGGEDKEDKEGHLWT